MTIPRNLGNLAQGADSNGVLGTAKGGTGLTALGTAGQAIVVNSTATGLEFSTPSTASPPYGGLMPVAGQTENTFTAQGATWLKSGVVAPSTTYPNAPSAPFLSQNDNAVSNTHSIGNSKFPAYGASKWVYPVTDGVMVSPDLLSWTFVSITGITTTTQLAFVNNQFVMIQGATIYQSSNGTTWTSANSMPVSGNWIKPIWTGTYYITGNSSTTNMAYSTNLSSWTQVSLGSGYSPACVGWNGSYVIFGCSGNAIAYSSNQTSYTILVLSQGNAANSLTLSSIAWNGSRWVILSDGVYDSGYSYIYQWAFTSTTGTSGWGGPYQAITQYAGQVGVIGTDFYTIGQQSIYSQYATYGYYSSNGSSWTSLSTQYVSYYTYPPKGSSNGALATDGTKYVMGNALTVDNGVSWGNVNTNLQSLNSAGVAYNSGVYVMAMYASPSNGYSQQFGYSTDGTNWQIRPINTYAAQYNSVVYFNNKWILGGDNKFNINSAANAIYSSNTTTWSNTSGGAYGKLTVAGSYVLASPYYSGNDGTYYHYSTDGINWTGNSVPSSGYQSFFAYGNSIYMAINRSDRVYTQNTPTSTWVDVNFYNFGNIPIGLFFAYNAFFVITQAGSVFKSTNNGVNWTPITVSGSNDIGNAFQFASYDGTYIIASSSGSKTYLVTNDGINWYYRKTASLTFGPYSSIANGVVTVPSVSTGSLSFSVNYVLNDSAQYGYTGSGTGTQMYMRVG